MKKLFPLMALLLSLSVLPMLAACDGGSPGSASSENVTERGAEFYTGNGSAWCAALFEGPSSEYDNDLATVAAELCEESEDTDPDKIKALYAQYGMSNVKDYNYTTGPLGKLVGGSACAIGYDVLSINGEPTTVVAITARGSVSAAELLGDYHSGEFLGENRRDFYGNEVYQHVHEFYESLSSALDDYLSIHPEISNANRLVVFITGHSLGGAAANMLGAEFDMGANGGTWWSERLQPDDVYVYTFGAIKVLTSDEGIDDGYENIHNIYNYYDSFGPHGTKATLGASSPYAKFGHADIYRDERVHDTEVLGADNHLMSNYKRALELQGSEKILQLACIGRGGAGESSSDDDTERVESSDTYAPAPGGFSIEGSWKSVGSVGFGQAQPGITVTFDGEQCNFYSPADTYRLYESGGTLKLDCTNMLWKDTLTFDVEVVDNDHITIYTGSPNTTTQLERLSAGGSSGDGLKYIDGMFANFDLPIILAYDFYDDGVVFGCWLDDDGAVLTESEGEYSISNGMLRMSVDMDAAAKSYGLNIGFDLGKWTSVDVPIEIDGDYLYIGGMEFERIA
ncbi:MAG: hypothetical protein IJ111_02530 [Eggerthellaceae bacterium]|nr:hypothetical protein [Eggerthellaceae bacterium]